MAEKAAAEKEAQEVEAQQQQDLQKFNDDINTEKVFGQFLFEPLVKALSSPASDRAFMHNLYRDWPNISSVLISSLYFCESCCRCASTSCTSFSLKAAVPSSAHTYNFTPSISSSCLQGMNAYRLSNK